MEMCVAIAGTIENIWLFLAFIPGFLDLCYCPEIVLLDDPTHLAGLVRNLALTSENLPVLYENRCVDSLWHILNRANQESHRRGHPGAPSGFIVRTCISGYKACT